MKIIFIVFFSLLLGCGSCLAYRWSEVIALAYPTSTSKTWAFGELNTDVLEKTADIEQILQLQPPLDDASVNEWLKFVEALHSVGIGASRHTGKLSPLLVWYVYIAQHRPETLYELMRSNNIAPDIINHLWSMGLLQDWHGQVENAFWLLSSEQAFKYYAMEQGAQVASKQFINHMLRVAQSDSSKSQRIKLSLENLRFALQNTPLDQHSDIVEILFSGKFKYDPRDVKFLVDLEGFSKRTLVQLIRQQAYPCKSMSSYMTTALELGDEGYLSVLLEDVADNAKQPTNFYCSACALALFTDGLIGTPLYKSLTKNQLKIEKSSDTPFVLEASMQQKNDRRLMSDE